MRKHELIQYALPERLSEVPDVVCSKAGILVSKNAGWRSERPVLDPKICVACGQCYLYCPDGVISRKDATYQIDYDFCKGCGICAAVCKRGAIRMEEER